MSVVFSMSYWALLKEILSSFLEQSVGKSKAREMFCSILDPHEVFYMGIPAFDGLHAACHRNHGGCTSVSVGVLCRQTARNDFHESIPDVDSERL